MSEDLNKKVLVTIELASDSATAAVDALKQKIDALNASVKSNRTVLLEAEAASSALSEELAKEVIDHERVKKAIDQAKLSQIQANIATKEAKKNIVAAKGSYDEAQKSLTALGRAIKSTEGGFQSTNPKIKEQIAQYNKLNTQLKSFDAKLGNHQRNVGNYERALDGVHEKLSALIPGFAQASAALQLAAQGFNAVKGNSDEAEAGFSALRLGAIGLSGGLALVAAGVASVIYYLGQFRETGEMVEQYMGGLKLQFANFGKNLVDMFTKKDVKISVKNFFKNFKESFNEGVDETKQMQEVKNLNEVNDATIQKMQAQADEARAQAKNVAKSSEERIESLKRAQKIENDIIDQQRDNAAANIDAAISISDKFKSLNEDQKRLLATGSQGAIRLANDYVKAGKITEAGYELLMQGYNRQTQAMSAATMKLIRQQNDESKILNKSNNDEVSNLAEAQRGIDEANNRRKVAIAKTLQDQMDAFGKELALIDEDHRQKIFKEQEFQKKMAELSEKTKSPKAKAKYGQAIAASKKAAEAEDTEYYSTKIRAVTEYYKKVNEAVEKGELEIASIQIARIKDQTAKELAGLEIQHRAEQHGYQKEEQQLSIDINNTMELLKGKQGEERQALQDHLDQLLNLQGINQDKSIQSTKNYEDQRLEIKKAAAEREQMAIDEANITKTGYHGSSQNVKANYAAQQKKLDDEHNFNLQRLADGKITTGEFQKMDEDYIKDSMDLKKKAALDLKNFEIKMAQTAADSSFNIVQNSIQQQAQAREAALSRQKTFELNNQALTSTQRAQVEERYRIKEGQAKQKEFKQEQKLNISKAIIDGALAIVAANENPFAAPFIIPTIIATTAAQIGVIAAQKPPAYAVGGVHSGDGIVRGPGTGTSDSVNAKLSNGEAVINAKSTSMFKPLLSAINQMGGGVPFGASFIKPQWLVPHFASGGVFLPTNDNGLRPNMPMSANLSNDSIAAMAGMVNDHITNVVRNIRPVVDVKDVNYQQGTIAEVQNRVNY
jgi:hypothetical protein